jgi:hypothetical protein
VKLACFTALALLSLTLTARAAVVTFEGAPLGVAPSYTEAGVFFQAEDGSGIEIRQLSFGRGILSQDIPFKPIRADLPVIASFVSVVLGDDSDDQDNMFLRGFSSGGVLLAQDTAFMPAQGTRTLSINTPGVAYVIFGSSSTINNSSVMADILEFNAAIPEPSTFLLMVSAFLPALLFRRNHVR